MRFYKIKTFSEEAVEWFELTSNLFRFERCVSITWPRILTELHKYNLYAAQTFPCLVSCLCLLRRNVGIVMYSSYVISYSMNPELCGGKEI